MSNCNQIAIAALKLKYKWNQAYIHLLDKNFSPLSLPQHLWIYAFTTFSTYNHSHIHTHSISNHAEIIPMNYIIELIYFINITTKMVGSFCYLIKYTYTRTNNINRRTVYLVVQMFMFLEALLSVCRWLMILWLDGHSFPVKFHYNVLFVVVYSWVCCWWIFFCECEYVFVDAVNLYVTHVWIWILMFGYGEWTRLLGFTAKCTIHYQYKNVCVYFIIIIIFFNTVKSRQS